MKSLGWTLMQSDRCPHQEKRLITTEWSVIMWGQSKVVAHASQGEKNCRHLDLELVAFTIVRNYSINAWVTQPVDSGGSRSWFSQVFQCLAGQHATVMERWKEALGVSRRGQSCHTYKIVVRSLHWAQKKSKCCGALIRKKEGRGQGQENGFLDFFLL